MRSYTHEQIYRIALQCAPSLTWRHREQLMQAYGNAESVFSCMDEGVRSIIGDKGMADLRMIRKAGARDILRQLEECGADVVFREEQEYPALLREISDPPQALFVRGTCAQDTKSVAVVGSRRDTRYGRTQAYSIARDLAKAGITVVSGLARGIDTAAHEGALAGGGRTVAVMGNGIDRVYPEENAALAQRIRENGGAVVTEFPFGAEPLAFHFPVRNRIISGISSVLLLIEGHARSGTMITAGCALEQGREVYALPGPVDAPGSAAPLRLLREGAALCTCAEDILSDMGWMKADLKSEKGKQLPLLKLEGLTELQKRIADLMREEPRRFEELTEETGMPADMLAAELTLMELDGIVENRPGRVYALKY
ncbi:MAG: DNA-processing protein DprA [Clostridia bacterium]|nr:DNA-processing protein DprA [Clostridia bacterium]